MRSIVILLLVVNAVVTIPPKVCAEQTAKEILAAIKHHDSIIQNASVVTRWQDSFRGTAYGEEEIADISDNLGRHWLSVSTASSPNPVRVVIFDGESTLIFSPQFDSAHVGAFPNELLPAEWREKIEERLAHGSGTVPQDTAFLYQGHFPNEQQNDFHTTRRPLAIMVQELKALLVDVESGNATFRAERSTENSDTVAYSVIRATDPSTTFRFECSARSGSLPTSIQVSDSSQRILASRSARYAPAGPELWIPVEGVVETFSYGDQGQKQPELSWKFECRSYKLNDPTFDESVFQIRLPKKTWVVDNRYGVAYGLGEDVESVKKLDQYVAEGQQRVRDWDGIYPKSTALPPKPRRSFGTLIAANVILAVVIAIALLVRRFRGAKK